jgi:hypothetical protein
LQFAGESRGFAPVVKAFTTQQFSEFYPHSHEILSGISQQSLYRVCRLWMSIGELEQDIGKRFRTDIGEPRSAIGIHRAVPPTGEPGLVSPSILFRYRVHVTRLASTKPLHVPL